MSLPAPQVALLCTIGLPLCPCSPALLYRGPGDPTTSLPIRASLILHLLLLNPLIDATAELDHRAASKRPLRPYAPESRASNQRSQVLLPTKIP